MCSLWERRSLFILWTSSCSKVLKKWWKNTLFGFYLNTLAYMHTHHILKQIISWNNTSLCVIHCSFSKRWSWPSKGIQFPWNMTNSSWFGWDFLGFSTVSAISRKPLFQFWEKQGEWSPCLHVFIVCLQLPFLVLMSFQAIAWRLSLKSASSLWNFLTLPVRGKCSFLSAPIEHLVSLLQNLLHCSLGCFSH